MSTALDSNKNKERLSVPEHFAKQAAACEALGSPFTGRVCRLLPSLLSRKSAFGTKVLGWSAEEGRDPASDALALRAAGAFHALLRAGSAVLQEVYPPVSVDDAALKSALEAAIEAEDAFLTAWLESAPQTNEVSRSSALLGGALHIAEKTRLPLDIYEIGASAALNLSFDRYAYELETPEGMRRRDGALPVTVTSRWEGPLPPLGAPLKIGARRGCELNPLPASDVKARERLLSYIWPDQTARLARIEAALKATAEAGLEAERADAAAWIAEHFSTPGKSGRVRLLFHTIVWQYLPQKTKAEIEKIMEDAAEHASDEAPLAWFSMEADAKDTSSAALRLRLWPQGIDTEIGRADFHGRWARWHLFDD